MLPCILEPVGLKINFKENILSAILKKKSWWNFFCYTLLFTNNSFLFCKNLT